MSPTRFTDTQGQYLAFIDAYTRVHGRPPAETDMQRHFGVSPPSVHQMVLTLERLGLVRRQPGVVRSIEVLLAPEDLPVLRHPEPIKSSLVPSERSTGAQVWRGSITKAGNPRARRVLIEGAWTYRYPARLSRPLQVRQESLPTVVRAIA